MAAGCERSGEGNERDQQEFAKGFHTSSFLYLGIVRLKHFPGVAGPLVNVRLREAGAVPLLGILQPGARGSDVVVLGKDSPKRRVNKKGFHVRWTVYREIQLFQKDHEVVGIPGDEHFIE